MQYIIPSILYQLHRATVRQPSRSVGPTRRYCVPQIHNICINTVYKYTHIARIYTFSACSTARIWPPSLTSSLSDRSCSRISFSPIADWKPSPVGDLPWFWIASEKAARISGKHSNTHLWDDHFANAGVGWRLISDHRSALLVRWSALVFFCYGCCVLVCMLGRSTVPLIFGKFSTKLWAARCADLWNRCEAHTVEMVFDCASITGVQI